MNKHLHLAVLIVLVFLVINQKMQNIYRDIEAWTERMETELQRAKKNYDEAIVRQLNRKSA
jgi:predicted Holliday junction resolvase-like endonuclease